VDGDTFDLLDDARQQHRIRPAGCDTPKGGGRITASPKTR
jgi:hypothetical protein